jgi:hypothetical protein
LPWLHEEVVQRSAHAGLKLDEDVAHESDHEAKPQRLQQSEPTGTAKATVAQDGRSDAGFVDDIGQIGDDLSLARRLDRGLRDRARAEIDAGPARASTLGRG